MGHNKNIIIAITGHIITDQRMIRIASTLQANQFNVTVYYRPYFKFKVKRKKVVDSYPFNIRKMVFMVNNGILFYAFYNIRLFLLLLFRRADLYCAVDSDTLVAFTLLSKLKNTPLIYDAHEYFAEVPELKNKTFKQNIWHWITQKGVNQSINRYTVSESLAKALSERYKAPFETIRNVPHYQEKDIHIKFDKPTILYQGALNQGRELELLINSMKQLPEFDCLIIGEGDLSSELRMLAKHISNVQFLGLLSPEKINTITQKVFLGFNLLDATSLSYYYSLSNKYFDYMQAGIPSISSNLPEYELLNKTLGCGVCIPNSEINFISCVKKYANDRTAYNNLQQNALLASLNNNWELESQKLVQIYTAI
ncbi:MAG: glycosyltransferase [bacterium]|nr:glycosyltransferase [bacterium]